MILSRKCYSFERADSAPCSRGRHAFQNGPFCTFGHSNCFRGRNEIKPQQKIILFPSLLLFFNELFFYLNFSSLFVPFPPTPCNHHTVVHTHEFFLSLSLFLFCSIPPPLSNPRINLLSQSLHHFLALLMPGEKDMTYINISNWLHIFAFISLAISFVYGRNTECSDDTILEDSLHPVFPALQPIL